MGKKLDVIKDFVMLPINVWDFLQMGQKQFFDYAYNQYDALEEDDRRLSKLEDKTETPLEIMLVICVIGILFIIISMLVS